MIWNSSTFDGTLGCWQWLVPYEMIWKSSACVATIGCWQFCAIWAVAHTFLFLMSNECSCRVGCLHGCCLCLPLVDHSSCDFWVFCMRSYVARCVALQIPVLIYSAQIWAAAVTYRMHTNIWFLMQYDSAESCSEPRGGCCLAGPCWILADCAALNLVLNLVEVVAFVGPCWRLDRCIVSLPPFVHELNDTHMQCLMMSMWRSLRLKCWCFWYSVIALKCILLFWGIPHIFRCWLKWQLILDTW